MSEEARRDQVMEWAVKADAASCEHLEAALTDPVADIRQRAATALYGRCDKSVTAQRAAPAICRSIELGNSSAGAYLLLGYARREQAEPCLRKPIPAWAAVKAATSTKPVPAALAARVALARLGDETARTELRRVLAKPTVTEAMFLLAILQDINDPESLRAAVGLLDDKRECPSSRSNSTRILREVALEALEDRLALKLSYKIQLGQRYSDAEIGEGRTAALAAVAALRNP